jgi:hypothetical protein
VILQHLFCPAAHNPRPESRVERHPWRQRFLPATSYSPPRQEFLNPHSQVSRFFGRFGGGGESHKSLGGKGVEWLRVDLREKARTRLCKKLKLYVMPRKTKFGEYGHRELHQRDHHHLQLPEHFGSKHMVWGWD